jgi:hypothetical protein
MEIKCRCRWGFLQGMRWATAFARKENELLSRQKVECKNHSVFLSSAQTEVIMPPEVQELAAEVLGLPAQDRAKILELLLSSFEPTPDSEKAWMSLALKRREQVRSGEVAMASGTEAMSRVRARIA